MPESIISKIRDQLLAEPSWRFFVGDGSAWICPCCSATVRAARMTTGNLLRAMHDHLELACPAWHAGNPGPGADSLCELRDEEELRFRLAHDSAFRIEGSDGSWICPGCLQALPHMTTLDERHAAVLAHRQDCAELREWRLHTAAEVSSSPLAGIGFQPVTAGGPAPAEDEIHRELSQARELQLSLMRHPPSLTGFHIATYYEACTELSGDFNQFVHLGDGRLAFAQGDVSGHGVRAGMFMAMANKLVELFAVQGLDPRQIVIQLHRAMVKDLSEGKNTSFITMVYAILDLKSNSIVWVRAGHNPALVWRAAKNEVEELTPAGMAVGLPVGEMFMTALKEERTQLAPGDMFMLYTDGIDEAMNPSNEQFGRNRLIKVVQTAARQGPETLVQAIVSAVTAHRCGRAMADDYSLIVIGVDDRASS